jgi:aminoglycoside phosphotransferase (APT) family kinase protein
VQHPTDEPRAAAPPHGRIADDLLRYVHATLGQADATYAVFSDRFATGVENLVYGLSFNGVSDALSGPLVLKLFPAHAEGARARFEAIVQNEVASQGYPAPRVVHVCEDGRPLGAPFLLMERLPGALMLEPLAGRNPSVLRLLPLVRQMFFEMPEVVAAQMAWLHRLDPDPLVARLDAEGLLASASGLDALMDRVRRQAEGAPCAGIAEGAQWLFEHRPAEPARPVICHGDLWFGNILRVNQTVTGVLDWASELVYIGDPLYDVGITSAVLKCGMPDVPGPLKSLVRRAQLAVAKRFLRAYARALPVDPDRLRYYELLRCFGFAAFAAGRRLDATQRTREQRDDMLEVEGGITGFIRYFATETDVELTMPS